MSEADSKFKGLRVNLRRHGMSIADSVLKCYHPACEGLIDEVCVFCNSPENITKEHVLPKWMLDYELHNTMVSSVNKQTATYNQSVVPACADCNNSLLGDIERNIIKLIQILDKYNDCYTDGVCDIIRWLEIIEYKFQVLDCRRVYIKYGDGDYDREWGKIPVAMMRHFWELNPWRAYNLLRRAQRRISTKEKSNRINSILFITTKMKHFYFFVQPDEYIYLSFPMYNVAVFYFVRKSFESYKDAADEARDIILRVVNSK